MAYGDKRSAHDVKNMDILTLFNKMNQLYSGAYSPLLEPSRGNPIDVLVATILSQATNDTLSSRAFAELKSSFPDWESVLSQDPQCVEEALACGGLHREKTKKIRGALGKIKADFNEITLDPLFDWTKERSFEYLISLPGVGPKTAACVLAFGLGKPAFPVDTHILRVAKRLGFAGEKESAVSVQSTFEDLVPEELKMPLHVMLIEHGRNICSSRKPKCPLCPLSADCSYFRVKGGLIAGEGLSSEVKK
ncbi:MAG: endonuclease III domain-containing protein [Bacillota bacterium]|jgi:endonuclease-3